MKTSTKISAKKPVTIVANDPSHQTGKLKAVGGSASDDWNNRIASATAQALWLKNSDEPTRVRSENLIQANKLSRTFSLARRISERIRAALQAAKARGVKLGSPIAAKTAAAARAVRSQQVTKANATTRAVIDDIRRSGISTLAAIAKTLEARGVRAPAGRTNWQPVQVARLLAA